MCQRWPLHLDLLHLEIGDRGEQLRVPVDQPLVLVDQALVVERDEHLEHRARQPLVHGEALARPVARGAEPLELAGDGAAGSPPSRPRPAPGTSSRPMSRRPGSWRSINCRSTTICVAMPAWSVPGCHSTSARASARSGQDVLQRVVERVAHVQRAGHVRRRDDDAVGRGAARARAGRRGRRPPAPSPHRCGLRPRSAGMSCQSCRICIVL